MKRLKRLVCWRRGHRMIPLRLDDRLLRRCARCRTDLGTIYDPPAEQDAA